MSSHPYRGFQYAHGDYVYYQRLRTDGYYPFLASVVNARQMIHVKEASDLEMIAGFFSNAASAELTKELNLLNEKFGGNISGDYGEENFAKKLITAINECLGIKKIFERNLALIKESNGQKNVMSWFPTYFQKVWESRADGIFAQAAENFTGGGNVLPGDALAKAVDAQLPDMVREAITNMFNAKVESGIKNQRDQYADAYQELIGAVNSNSDASNEFVQSFIRNYHLNDFIETLRKSMQDMASFKGSITSKFNIKSQVAARGGLTMEDFRTFCINIIGSGLGAAKGVSVGGITTGRTNMKPDTVGTIDIPIGIIEDWMEKNSFGTREKDTAAALKLQQTLEKFDGGFITYVNAKNYSLNNNFKHGAVWSNGTIQIPGFSAGNMISLKNFDAAAANLGIDYQNLIDVCLQIIPGAIGEGQVEEVKTALTKAIASALFDDFNMVGAVETTGAQSVHLLDLNGVLMPVSFYFYLLGQAFQETASFKVEDLVSVQIDMPGSILYPSKTAEERHGGSEARWTAQSVDAMTKIRIGYHFMAAFQEIMQTFM